MLKQILSKIPRNKLSSKSEGHSNQGGRGDVNHSVSLSGPGAKNPNSGSIPMVQGRFPSGVKTAPFPIGGCNDFIEPLPSFRDVPNSEKQNLFIRKLVLCCTVFDFSDTTKNTREKEIKRQTLIELVDFVSSSTSKFSELAIEEIVRMVSANIFRALPPSTHEIVAVDLFDPEEDEPSMEPAWSHLQLIYDLFLRFITSTEIDAKVVKRYVDHSFILKLVDLFESEDSRERECLKTILHRIYGKFMVHRPFIRKSINNVLYRFIFETERHNGIAELLEILGSIINGFALPLKEEHKLFLVRVLIPLHKPKCVSFYHRQLTYCITQFVEKEMKLADTVIRGLLRYWPLTNSQKEVLFLGELEEVLEATQPAEFQRCMLPLFRQIGKCISSANFQVAERALFLWNNDHIIHLVTHNLEVILPLVFPALETNTKNHWNQAVHSLTLNTRKLLMELDHDLFLECKRKFDEEEAKKNMMRERRELIWQQLDDLASTSVPCKSPSLVLQSKKV